MSLLPHRDPSREEADDLTVAAESDLIHSLERRLASAQLKAADLEAELRKERIRADRLERELRQLRRGQAPTTDHSR